MDVLRFIREVREQGRTCPTSLGRYSTIVDEDTVTFEFAGHARHIVGEVVPFMMENDINFVLGRDTHATTLTVELETLSPYLREMFIRKLERPTYNG